MQIWNGIETEPGSNLTKYNQNYFLTISQIPALQETEFLIIALEYCHRGTPHCPDVPSTLKFGNQDHPPPPWAPLPSSWWRLLGDSSMRVVPRGAGSGQIYTLNSVEQSFHQSRSPFLHVFPSIGGCHLGKTSAIRGWYLQGFWHQPNESGQFPSIIRSRFHSFDLGRWIHLNNEHGVAWHQCIAMEEIIIGTALLGRCRKQPNS